jgi:predicted RNase H-like HicB family nuclease
MRDFSFDTHIFKEGDTYVAYAPALDVSSCGATEDEARRNIRDAVRGFLAASAEMGTLSDILEEAGYEPRIRQFHSGGIIKA